jgi:hypothetical protein
MAYFRARTRDGGPMTNLHDVAEPEHGDPAGLWRQEANA